MTLTLPDHTGMVTGRRIDETGGHGVTWNDARFHPAHGAGRCGLSRRLVSRRSRVSGCTAPCSLPRRNSGSTRGRGPAGSSARSTRTPPTRPRGPPRPAQRVSAFTFCTSRCPTSPGTPGLALAGIPGGGDAIGRPARRAARHHRQTPERGTTSSWSPRTTGPRPATRPDGPPLPRAVPRHGGRGARRRRPLRDEPGLRRPGRASRHAADQPVRNGDVANLVLACSACRPSRRAGSTTPRTSTCSPRPLAPPR